MFTLKGDMAPGQVKELILPNRQHRYKGRNNPDFTATIVKPVPKDLKVQVP